MGKGKQRGLLPGLGLRDRENKRVCSVCVLELSLGMTGRLQEEAQVCHRSN